MKKTLFSLLTLAFLGLSTTHAQVGIGTTTPDASAAFEIQSTDKGFLPPRMTTAQRDAISNLAEGLTIYNTDVKCLDTYNGVRWINCNTIGATDVYNPATGQVWMDRNLGATQVATSSTDANSYGHLYQWGRGTDGHQIRTSGVTTTLSSSDQPGNDLFISTNGGGWRSPQNDNLWQGVSGINNPCPSGFRIPTEAEWLSESQSWSSQNIAGAFASPLKLPVAGVRYAHSGTFLHNVGVDGYYQTSTISNTQMKPFIVSSMFNVYMGTSSRSNGNSVRCIKD
jgi:uncharacterized protein (TIGR02145 family)